MGVNVRRRLYEGVAVPTALYGAETWSMAVAEKKKLNVMGMMCLRIMCGGTCIDQTRNEVRRKTGVMRVGWLSRAVVEVVWTHGENGGGLVAEEKSRIRCEKCDIEIKATSGMEGRCE